MGTTFQLSAIDLYDVDALWDEEAAAELADLRVCRSTNCDDFAHGGDDFCPRCRDEIDALHEMYARTPRRRRP
jgi:hypothetical protein